MQIPIVVAYFARVLDPARPGERLFRRFRTAQPENRAQAADALPEKTEETTQL